MPNGENGCWKRMSSFVNLAIGLVVCAVCVDLAIAAPPKGKGGGKGDMEPPPPGTIYYRELGIWGTLADGSGSDLALAIEGNNLPEPSHLVYGSEAMPYRLWLRGEQTDGMVYNHVTDLEGNRIDNYDLPHNDLWVYRDFADSDAVESFRVTDLFGSFLLSPLSVVRWSNDGQDSFVSFRGYDLRDAFSVEADGTTHLDFSSLHPGIFLIELTGSAIDAEPLVGPESVETVVTYDEFYENNFVHAWSPDGTKVAYVFDGTPSLSGADEDLFVIDLLLGTTTKVWDGDSWTKNPRFSPTTGELTFSYEGDVWAVDPDDPSSATVLIPDSGPAYWSPDGDHMSFVEVVTKGFKREYFISRISLLSGEVTRVTAGGDKANGKQAFPWVSNSLVAP